MPVALGFSLLAGPAWADEVAPRGKNDPTLVATGQEEKIYYPLGAGESLSYDTPGPTAVVVQVRRRLQEGDITPDPVTIEVLGDGVLKVFDLQIDEGPTTAGVIYDDKGGLPSLADGATITVPQGGSYIVLQTQDGPHDFLVRVTDGDEEVPEVSEAPLPEPPPPLEEISVEVPDTDPAVAEQVEDLPTPPKKPFLGSEPIEAGLELGGGFPARGNRMVGYIGARVRTELLEGVTGGASIGTYRIGVNDDIRIGDPFLGVVQIPVDYHTTVVPFFIEVAAHPPLDLEIAKPFVSVGGGFVTAVRKQNEATDTAFTVGTEWAVGADVELGPGTLVPRLSWNGARLNFGNTNDDESVNETVATTRLGVGYLYEF